jgi:hypothetical protein
VELRCLASIIESKEVVTSTENEVAWKHGILLEVSGESPRPSTLPNPRQEKMQPAQQKPAGNGRKYLDCGILGSYDVSGSIINARERSMPHAFKLRLLVAILVLLNALVVVKHIGAITFSTIDHPLGVNGTRATGIYGNRIVGVYYDSSELRHGFVYDGTSFTTIDHPLGASGSFLHDVVGDTLVGAYQDSGGKYHGFIYDGSSFTTLDEPHGITSGGTITTGMSGNQIVGGYYEGTRLHGFIYNGSTYTTVDHPTTNTTRGSSFADISDGRMVGTYYSSSTRAHGYIYDGANFVTINPPLGVLGSEALGIYGVAIVGYYEDSFGAPHGYYFNGTSFLTIDHPLARIANERGTKVVGIEGADIVGYYYDASNKMHGFLAQSVPEPSAIAIGICAAIGAVVLRHRFTA